MNNKQFNDDDYCDIYEKKVCDNCGKCLELDGVDTKAIKIEDIAKDVEENKFLEEELKKALESAKEEQEEVEDNSEIDWDKVGLEDENDEYEDAFEHIEYLDDMDELLNDELQLEELTEEVFPGVRKLKRK